MTMGSCHRETLLLESTLPGHHGAAQTNREMIMAVRVLEKLTKALQVQLNLMCHCVRTHTAGYKLLILIVLHHDAVWNQGVIGHSQFSSSKFAKIKTDDSGYYKVVSTGSLNKRAVL